MNLSCCDCKWILSNLFSSICAATSQAANVMLIERMAPNNYSFQWTSLLSANHAKGNECTLAEWAFSNVRWLKEAGFLCHYTTNNIHKPWTVKWRLFVAMAALNTESVFLSSHCILNDPAVVTECENICCYLNDCVVFKDVWLAWYSLTASTELSRYTCWVHTKTITNNVYCIFMGTSLLWSQFKWKILNESHIKASVFESPET